MTATLLLWIPGCSTLDERDECCEAVTLIYRYVPTTKDEYRDHIREIRHYLFDAHGVFLREITQTSPHSQRIFLLSLPVGRYSVLTLANASDRYSELPEMREGVTRLEELTLAARYGTYTRSGDGDPLFWNLRDFEARRDERHTYYCDLSNIHCRLYVRVVWKNGFPPSGAEDYRLELDALPTVYRLCRPVHNGLLTYRKRGGDLFPQGGSTLEQSWHEFPVNGGAEGKITLPVSLFNNELKCTFLSLRYTNTQQPTLRIYHRGRLYRKELDLSLFFRDQGIRPDGDPVQDYKIVVEIGKSSIKVYYYTGSRIVDWQDGGSFQVGM